MFTERRRWAWGPFARAHDPMKEDLMTAIQETKLLRLVKAMTKEGEAPSAIASYLNDREILSPRGNAWTAQTVSRWRNKWTQTRQATRGRMTTASRARTTTRKRKAA